MAFQLVLIVCPHGSAWTTGVAGPRYLDKKNIVHAVSVGYPELCHLVGRVNRYVPGTRARGCGGEHSDEVPRHRLGGVL